MSEPLHRRALLRSALQAGLVAGAAALLPRPLAAAPLAKVKADGRLRVGVYADNRPWSWTEGGVLRGIDVDLGKALARALGVEPQVVEFFAGDDLGADLRNVVWRGGLLGFQPCDVMLHVPFDRQLMIENDQVAIVAPYTREGFGLVCGPEGGDCEAPPVQFRGKRIAAETATLSDAYLLGSFGGVLRSNVRHFQSGYAAMAAVGTGTADVAMGTRAQVEAALHDFPAAGLKRRKGPIPALPSPGWDVAMAVKDNSRTLGDALETIVGELVAKGAMASIFATYGVEWHAALAG
ncbi:substrate-binding periplasmic protein [Novosphingobium aerophilum]|uniref:Transporter substrate-binding domain-containing protein n=1 Tax=Novosphingobium aerophilum TaxID=2839843 RepID=A0A7X1FAI4_9SPHN|nr:transporter substrate-binding domain-containing protein [Novosphingobium aerophilum]MBC2653426.1 transporter substrate-binding domain-containing protein [Novosphingobium aerophilum]